MSTAELSSLAATVDDVLRRVTAMADHRTAGGKPDDVAKGLYEVERSLREARRRIQRVLDLSA